MSCLLELDFKEFEDREGLVEGVIKEKLAKIEKICPKATSCHVTIEQLQNQKHHQHSYHIRVAVAFPHNHEVVVTRDPNKGETQGELLTTQIRDAFIAARRQIQEILDRDRGKIKHH